ncbi:MAG: BNR-4 repeat-containing protein [Saprospiraceae bacterium]|nr:BNR-4 repeat-containing protein [Saprospiraceae bacterium]
MNSHFSRRTFLYHLGRTGLSLPFINGLTSAKFDGDSIVLSQNGCGRATGYAEANKIISAAGKTFFSWLESEDGKFAVFVRSFDHKSQKLSKSIRIGDAHDNHGGPALTIDRDGFLHIVYFPHHHPMRYRKALAPYSIERWEEESSFGVRTTYPTLTCGPDNNLYCTVRESDDSAPWEVHLYRKSNGAPWHLSRKLMKSRFNGYSHFQESMSWSPGDQTLHLLCRFHEGSDGNAYGRLQTVAYMQSADLGETWHKLDGKVIETPAEVESLDVLAKGGEDYGILLRTGGMSVDNFGIPHLIYSEQEGLSGKCFLVVALKNGTWRYTLLNDFLPQWFKSWMLTMPGGISFDQQNNMYIVAQIKRMEEGEKYWGHPTNEVVLLYSEDGGDSFTFELLSELKSDEAHWLPNIERNTGHNFIESRPWLMYTSGAPGRNNQDILENKVMASRL